MQTNDTTTSTYVTTTQQQKTTTCVSYQQLRCYTVCFRGEYGVEGVGFFINLLLAICHLIYMLKLLFLFHTHTHINTHKHICTYIYTQERIGDREVRETEIFKELLLSTTRTFIDVGSNIIYIGYTAVHVSVTSACTAVSLGYWYYSYSNL